MSIIILNANVIKAIINEFLGDSDAVNDVLTKQISNNFDIEICIGEATCILAYIGFPPSSDVLLKLGYAVASKKTIVIFAEDEASLPYFVRGLVVYDNVQIMYFNDAKHLFDQITKMTHEFALP